MGKCLNKIKCEAKGGPFSKFTYYSRNSLIERTKILEFKSQNPKIKIQIKIYLAISISYSNFKFENSISKVRLDFSSSDEK